jgi:spermidine/putrescine transport system ATP-binding protein
VALARALAPSPEVLLLDEPLSALDLKLRSGMQVELKRLQREIGITFIFVTHDQHEALTMSDKIAVMREGKVVQVGASAEVYERPTSRFVADFVGEANVLDCQRVGDNSFRIEGGDVLSTGAHDYEGGTAALVVRPERISLADSTADGLNGVVDFVLYEGNFTTITVKLTRARQTLKVRQLNGSDGKTFRVGDAVSVGISPDAIWICTP